MPAYMHTYIRTRAPLLSYTYILHLQRLRSVTADSAVTSNSRVIPWSTVTQIDRYIQTYTCQHTYTYRCMLACTPGCIRAYVHAYADICIYACIHVCIHACIPTCMHTCMDTHIKVTPPPPPYCRIYVYWISRNYGRLRQIRRLRQARGPFHN